MPVILESGCPRMAHTAWLLMLYDPTREATSEKSTHERPKQNENKHLQIHNGNYRLHSHMGNSNWLKNCFVFFSLNFRKIIEEATRQMDWLQAAPGSSPGALQASLWFSLKIAAVSSLWAFHRVWLCSEFLGQRPTSWCHHRASWGHDTHALL